MQREAGTGRSQWHRWLALSCMTELQHQSARRRNAQRGRDADPRLIDRSPRVEPPFAGQHFLWLFPQARLNVSGSIALQRARRWSRACISIASEAPGDRSVCFGMDAFGRHTCVRREIKREERRKHVGGGRTGGSDKTRLTWKPRRHKLHFSRILEIFSFWLIYL